MKGTNILKKIPEYTYSFFSDVLQANVDVTFIESVDKKGFIPINYTCAEKDVYRENTDVLRVFGAHSISEELWKEIQIFKLSAFYKHKGYVILTAKQLIEMEHTMNSPEYAEFFSMRNISNKKRSKLYLKVLKMFENILLEEGGYLWIIEPYLRGSIEKSNWLLYDIKTTGTIFGKYDKKYEDYVNLL